MRKKFIAGNWKMNKTEKEASSFLRIFKPRAADNTAADIVICAPFTLLSFMKEELKNTNIHLGAQNMYFEDKGAFTGEVSPLMIRELCEYVILGHSERRKYFGESDALVNKKIRKAIEHKLKVIFCLGETLDERKNRRTNKVIESQLKAGLAAIPEIKNIVVAYEPVWAIGTGNTATPQQAEEIHLLLRNLISRLYNQKVAAQTRIIYGGSVTQDNAADILKQANIDGCLPGGASLNPDSFLKIIKAA